MRSSSFLIVGATSLALSTQACAIHAQSVTNQRIDDVRDVARTLRAHGHAGYAVRVLTQTTGAQPREKLDAIADTLVSIAIAFPGADLRGARTRAAALSALLRAGARYPVSESGGKPGHQRVPYSGAAERLQVIAENAPDPGIAATALLSLPEMMNRAQLLPYLRRLAMSQNRVVPSVLIALDQETGAEGVAILHDLFRKRLVTQPQAQELLVRLAAARGW